MIGLTVKQGRTLAFLREYVARHGYAPKLDEIAAAVGLPGKSNAKWCVDGLVERGYVRRLPGRARAIELIAAPIVINGKRFRFIPKTKAA